MTTIMGLEFWDTENNENCAILGSDSQGSSLKANGSLNTFDYDAKKIITNGNLTFAHAGRLISPNIHYDKLNLSSPKKEIFEKEKHFSKEEANSIFNDLNNQFAKSPSEYSKNTFIYTFQEENPRIHLIDGKSSRLVTNEQAQLCSGAIAGSGFPYASDAFNKIMPKYFNKETQKYELTKNLAATLFALSIKEAEEKDDFTGGYFNTSFVTEKETETFYNLTKLKDINLNNASKKIERNIKNQRGVKYIVHSDFINDIGTGENLETLTQKAIDSESKGLSIILFRAGLPANYQYNILNGLDKKLTEEESEAINDVECLNTSERFYTTIKNVTDKSVAEYFPKVKYADKDKWESELIKFDKFYSDPKPEETKKHLGEIKY